jgi:hypothetical protein
MLLVSYRVYKPREDLDVSDNDDDDVFTISQEGLVLVYVKTVQAEEENFNLKAFEEAQLNVLSKHLDIATECLWFELALIKRL